MKLVTSNIEVDVKYKKLSVEQVVAKPEIVRRTPEGKPVHSVRVANGKPIETFKWRNLDEDGHQVKRSDIRYFQVIEDGSEKPVSPYDRTTEIKIVKEANMATVSEFLIEGYYELYHVKDEQINVLYQEAERYMKEDLVGIALFSWGNGFKQYYALVYPVVRDGKFVWIMKLTQTKLVYQHLMDMPETRRPIRKAPTIETLPPIEAIL